MSKDVGGNFVDMNLRVVAENQRGTLIIFRPDHLHGTTTLSGDASHRHACITFSRRLAESLRALVDEPVVEARACNPEVAGDGQNEE